MHKTKKKKKKKKKSFTDIHKHGKDCEPQILNENMEMTIEHVTVNIGKKRKLHVHTTMCKENGTFLH